MKKKKKKENWTPESRTAVGQPISHLPYSQWRDLLSLPDMVKYWTGLPRDDCCESQLTSPLGINLQTEAIFSPVAVVTCVDRPITVTLAGVVPRLF